LDYAEAFKWYNQAVGQGDLAAHLAITGFHFAYRKSLMPLHYGDYDIWRTKALVMSGIISSDPSFEENFWRDYHSKQRFYQNDSGVVKVLLARSAEGDGEAKLQLAKMALHAQGMARNRTIANRLVNEAAKVGNHNALFILGATFPMNELIAVSESFYRPDLLAKAAESRTEPFFASFYHTKVLWNNRRENGTVLSKDRITLHQGALIKLAEDGLVPAQYNLGMSLILDSGDFAVGFKWIEAAAREGDYTAQAQAGVLLMYGQGVAQDMLAGKEWLDKAINSNDSFAFSILHLLTTRTARGQSMR
jgi:TPR repeat protein